MLGVVALAACSTSEAEREGKTTACAPEELVVDDHLVPECGVLFGTLDPSPSVVTATPTMIGLDHQRDVVRLARPGAEDFEFGITRRYQRGPGKAAAALDGLLAEASLATGRRIYFNWKVEVGEGAWAAVAAGDYDDALRDVAATVDRRDQTLFFSLHHEPENDAEGSADDYIAMWRHVHDVIEGELAALPGAGSVVWVIDYMGHVDGEGLELVDAYYPGNDYVDWIAFNPYNWKYCGGRQWRPFAELARPMVDYLTTSERFLTDGMAKPLMVGETGTHEGETADEDKAQWLLDLSAALRSEEFAPIKAVVYYNQSEPNRCNWYWDSSPASAEAFVNIVTDPYFHPATVAPSSG